jgi:hypothetical protein
LLSEAGSEKVFVPSDFDEATFMEKWFCFGSMGAAGLVLVLFLLDLVMGFPFGGSSLIDVFGLITAGIVFFLGFFFLFQING